MKLDKNEAPEGAIAVEGTPGCNECMYFVDAACMSPTGYRACLPKWRRDGHSVIFKPSPKTTKRDSKGRFTSEQAEARKQLIDRAQFLAFSEAVKAMNGETITQTLGKKQAEVERNTKHAQTERQITFITPDGLEVCGIEYTLIDSDGENIFRMAIEDEGAGAFVAIKTDDSEIRLTCEELTALAKNGETLCKQMNEQHIETAKKEMRK